TDNPTLLEQDPDYINRLKAVGDPDLARALVEGDWSIAEGSQFGGVWSKAWHVCKSFRIPMAWDIWRSMDDGYVNPAAVLWCTYHEAFDRTYVIGELYGSGMLPEELSKRILERDKSFPRVDAAGNTNISTERFRGIIDAAAFANTGSGVDSRG